MGPMCPWGARPMREGQVGAKGAGPALQTFKPLGMLPRGPGRAVGKRRKASAGGSREQGRRWNPRKGLGHTVSPISSPTLGALGCGLRCHQTL